MFKGQLDYRTLVYDMSYKMAYEIRETRIQRLIKEKEEMDKEIKDKQSQERRNIILAK